jgi:hypothetical protein
MFSPKRALSLLIYFELGHLVAPQGFSSQSQSVELDLNFKSLVIAENHNTLLINMLCKKFHRIRSIQGFHFQSHLLQTSHGVQALL